MDRRKFIKGAAGLLLPVAPAIIRPDSAWAQLGGLGFPGPGPIHVTGGGGASTIFAPSAGPLNTDDNNGALRFRSMCTINAASLGKVKVYLTANSTVQLNLDAMCFGKWTGVDPGCCTNPMLNLTLAGATLITIPAGSTVPLDVLDHSASFSLASGDVVVVSHQDQGPPNNGQKFRNGLTNASFWLTVSTGSLTTANTQTPSMTDGWSQTAATDYIIEKIETL